MNHYIKTNLTETNLQLHPFSVPPVHYSFTTVVLHFYILCHFFFLFTVDYTLATLSNIKIFSCFWTTENLTYQILLQTLSKSFNQRFLPLEDYHNIKLCLLLQNSLFTLVNYLLHTNRSWMNLAQAGFTGYHLSTTSWLKFSHQNCTRKHSFRVCTAKLA